MTNRFVCAAIVLTLAALPGPAPAEPSPSPRATAEALPFVAQGSLPREQARDLYSIRARRLIRSYLRLQLLELHERQLDRIRAVIEGKLGVDTLFDPPATQAGIRAGGR